MSWFLRPFALPVRSLAALTGLSTTAVCVELLRVNRACYVLALLSDGVDAVQRDDVVFTLGFAVLLAFWPLRVVPSMTRELTALGEALERGDAVLPAGNRLTSFMSHFWCGFALSAVIDVAAHAVSAPDEVIERFGAIMLGCAYAGAWLGGGPKASLPVRVAARLRPLWRPGVAPA